MDERMRKCNEAFQSIKLIKMYAWERVFQRSIEATRGEELKLLLQAAFLRIASGNNIMGSDNTSVASSNSFMALGNTSMEFGNNVLASNNTSMVSSNTSMGSRNTSMV